MVYIDLAMKKRDCPWPNHVKVHVDSVPTGPWKPGENSRPQKVPRAKSPTRKPSRERQGKVKEKRLWRTTFMKAQ